MKCTCDWQPDKTTLMPSYSQIGVNIRVAVGGTEILPCRSSFFALHGYVCGHYDVVDA